MTKKLIGLDPDQVPVNGFLGGAAYFDPEDLPISTAVKTALEAIQPPLEGNEGKFLAVNTLENAVEWIDPPEGGPDIDVPTAAGKVLMSGNTPLGSTYWGDPPADGGSISPPAAGDAGKVLTAGDDLGTTYWATPSGGGSGPVIPMNTSGDVGKVLLAGATGGSTYWDAPPSGGYPKPTAPDAGKFLRAGDVLGTAYWDDLPSGGGGGGGDSSVLMAMRTTDITNQTLTLQPVLGVNVASGRQYLLKFMVMTRPTNLTQGIRIGFLGTFGNSSMQILGSYRGTDGELIQRTAVAKTDVMVFPNHEKGNDGNLLILEGLVHVTAAGTFQIGFSVDTEWDYCALVKGASLTMQDMGALAV